MVKIRLATMFAIAQVVLTKYYASRRSLNIVVEDRAIRYNRNIEANCLSNRGCTQFHKTPQRLPATSTNVEGIEGVLGFEWENMVWRMQRRRGLQCASLHATMTAKAGKRLLEKLAHNRIFCSARVWYHVEDSKLLLTPSVHTRYEYTSRFVWSRCPSSLFIRYHNIITLHSTEYCSYIIYLAPRHNSRPILCCFLLHYTSEKVRSLHHG